MGSGQSKYYRNGYNQQYPYAQQPPPPPPLYPGQYNAPFVPQYAPMPGYGAQMYPQQQAPGFIPPGVYGQGSQLPPPLLNWLPQDRRKSRRSKRRESERFVGGFTGSAPPPPQQEGMLRKNITMKHVNCNSFSSSSCSLGISSHRTACPSTCNSAT